MYKKIISITVFFIIIFFVPYSQAFGESGIQSLVKEYSYEIGPDLKYFKYEEDNLMEEKGFMYGAVGKINYHGIASGNNRLMANVKLECFGGALDYEGQTWDGTSLEEDTNDFLLEYRTLVGFDTAFGDTYLVSLFTGFGYRYWNNDIRGAGGYTREIEYMYQPLGVKMAGIMSNKWTWGVSAEYDFLWQGKVESHLSDVTAGLNDPEVKQTSGDGYGLKLSLNFKRKFSSKYSLNIEPYIRYWDIEKSDTETITLNGSPIYVNGNPLYVWEPENETTSYGLRVKFVF
ncbi:MAG: hypothetical protein K9K62_08475 [Desulfobacteraceae bacterium]|nr:hypothetical protein [Desulfobacteraceae bacterium]